MSRQKELDADAKAIQQKEFVVQLKKLDANSTEVDNYQSMFVLATWKKIKETKLKFSQWSITVF